MRTLLMVSIVFLVSGKLSWATVAQKGEAQVAAGEAFISTEITGAAAKAFWDSLKAKEKPVGPENPDRPKTEKNLGDVHCEMETDVSGALGGPPGHKPQNSYMCRITTDREGNCRAIKGEAPRQRSDSMPKKNH